MDFSNEAGPSSSSLSSSASPSSSSSTPSTPPTDPDHAYEPDSPSPSPPSLRDDQSGYLDDNPSFSEGLDIYSRLHFQTIDRVREEHEREYRTGRGGTSQQLDQIDLTSDDNEDEKESDDADDDDDTGSEWSITTSEFERRQEQEWVEAVQQLEMAFKLIICPLVGKYIGRRFAYWGQFIHNEIGQSRCQLTYSYSLSYSLLTVSATWRIRETLLRIDLGP